MKTLTSIFLFILLISCKAKLAPVANTDLVNTKWNYVDFEWNYVIQFNGDGHFTWTHPNETSPENETWKQEGDIVTMYSNDAYGTFTGTLYGTDSIIGTGVSIENETWTYKMYRIK